MERKQRKRHIEWGKNVLIVLLSISAIYLIGQSSFYEGFRMLLSQHYASQPRGETKLLESKAWQMSVQPVRLAIQNAEGRYGLQYDQKAVDELFEKKLGALLREAFQKIDRKNSLTEKEWKSVLSGTDCWVYYDFLGNIPLSQIAERVGCEEDKQGIDGSARRILLGEGDAGSKIYISYEGSEGPEYLFYTLKDMEARQIGAATEGFSPNGMRFAFEKTGLYSSVDGNLMSMDPSPEQSAYVSQNPLYQLTEEEQKELLTKLQFNPNAEIFHHVSDGLVVRGGADTLRILDTGVVMFQSKENGQVCRYPVYQSEPGYGVSMARKILLTVLMDDQGERGRPYLLHTEQQDDGRTKLTFAYSFNGAAVQMAEFGYAAQFTMDDQQITEFTIYARQYLVAEEAVSLLPEAQAIVALRAMGEEGREMQIGYVDTGEGDTILPEWIAY